MYQWRRWLAFATDILSKIPSDKDTVFVKFLKLAAIADSYDKMLGQGSSAEIYDFLQSERSKEITNSIFVDLFETTSLHELFDKQKIKFGENVIVTQAKHKDLGTLYFLAWTWSGKPQTSETFWHSENFQFERTLEVLWQQFSNRMHISLKTRPQDDTLHASFGPIPEPKDPLLGNTPERLQKTIEKHRRYCLDKVSRTYLFNGPPGVGKTTFALRFAEGLKERILRVDASTFTLVGINDLQFLVMGLKPGFILIDDIDSVPELDKALPTLFTVLSDLKTLHPQLTVVLTINDITKLNPALLRPGRINELFDFNIPSKEEISEILLGYMQEFQIPQEHDLTPLIDALEGLSGDHAREIALQLRYQTPEELLPSIKRMKDLSVNYVSEDSEEDAFED